MSFIDKTKHTEELDKLIEYLRTRDLTTLEVKTLIYSCLDFISFTIVKTTDELNSQNGEEEKPK